MIGYKKQTNRPPRKAKLWSGLWFWMGGIGLVVLVGVCLLNGCKAPVSEVVVYVAQDQVYADPILADFEAETGIHVRALYDSEAVKTVGLVNRLLAERTFPQCDVFWGNEEFHTRRLAAAGVFRQTNGWAAFGYRSRRMIINTNFLTLRQAPKSLLELTNQQWRGRVALAYPLFGTTATHFAVLRTVWGRERWEQWCRNLVANDPLVVDGNSVVARLVAKGEAWIGLTDSDDAAMVQRQGAPIAVLPMNAETLLIPNTVGVIRNAPHPDAAQRLFSYLLRPEVARRLVQAGALEGVDPREVTVKTLQPDWDKVLAQFQETTRFLKTVFLR